MRDTKNGLNKTQSLLTKEAFRKEVRGSLSFYQSSSRRGWKTQRDFASEQAVIDATCCSITITCASN